MLVARVKKRARFFAVGRQPRWQRELWSGQPGVLMAADALLKDNAKPTRDEIKEAMAGNLCRCTGYLKIFEAIELAAARMRGEDAEPSKESIYGA